MKWKKYFFIAWAVILAGSIAFAVYIRNSILPLDMTSSGLEKMTIRTEKGLYNLSDDSQFASQELSMQELYDSSDLVVKVTALDEREAKYESILTAVTVDEVYKGDSALKDKKIYVYEFAYIFLFDNEYLIDTYGGTYNIMNPGNQYYLLLNFNKMPDGYQYSKKDKNTYLISNIYFGKFSCDENHISSVQVIPEESMNQLRYADIKNWDILPKDSSEISEYTKKRKDLLNITNI